MKFRLTIQEMWCHEHDVARLEALGFQLERQDGLLYGCTHAVADPTAERFVAFDTIEQLVQFTVDNGACVVLPPRTPGELPTIHLAHEHEAR